ncbi:MAG TPA: hypothetical protein PLN21_06500 [Gemmatales bacterium]|nr:hypothetical protein [Gemmatales bacterium]
MIRQLLVLSFLMFGACTLSAFDDKIDSAKVIGKWSPEKEPAPGFKIVMEFAKENKITIAVDFQGKSEKVEGTYKLDGDQLSMTLSKDGQERTQKLKVVRLNDKELVLKEEGKDKEEVLKKVS